MNDSPKPTQHVVEEAASINSMGEAARRASIAQRVRVQQAALLDIMKGDVLSRALSEVIAEMTAIAARTLDVSRASLWRFSATRETLILADRFDLKTGIHADGWEMAASRYPSYFEALRWNRVISAPDASNDPRTSEFDADYLRPLGIVSSLDAAIWYSGQCQGVICLASIGEYRDWTPDEQQFAGSIADLVALAIENESRRNAQKRLSVSEEMFSRVFRLGPDWMVVTRESDGVLIDVNESFERQSGYTAAEAVGRTTLELGLWADPERRKAWFDEVKRANGRVRSMEADFRSRDGVVKTYQGSSERIEINGETCLISINRDVTDSKRQQRLVFDIAQGVAASTGESFFRSLVERLSQTLGGDLTFVGELSADDHTTIRTIAAQSQNGPAENFAYSLDGSPCQAILGRGVCAFPTDVALLFPNDTALMDKGIEAYVGAPLIDSAGKSLGLIAVLFKRPLESCDLAVSLLQIFAARASAELERSNQHAALEFRAMHDLLTGLMNRSALERHIDQTITSYPESINALLIIDLDRFKEINDTLGHAVGDAILVRVARRLKTENEIGTLCRGHVARLGGDEFAIWLEDLAEPRTAEIVASRTLAALTAPFDIQGYRLEIGASVGIALHPTHGNSVIDLLRCADIAMYVAKRRGTGYAFYDSVDNAYSPQRLLLIGQLGDAVRKNELELHFQPRLNLHSNQPTGFEALVRWRHPTMGLLPPSQFIPLAELSDVIRALTLWVLDHALAQVQVWSGLNHSMRMAVNLSARHLMDENCPDQIERLLNKHGVAPQFLELEITESAIIIDPERATRTLNRIHQMGVHVSIDDFGTGYSSLSHLKQLPLSALKIDMSFVANMLRNPKDAAIVESTIGLAHNLGLSVVAEGIEDAETLAYLRTLGCDEGQGFLIGRPMLPAQALDWILAR